DMLGAEYVCAELFFQKPSPKPFKEAMKKISRPPSSFMMIGDQIFTDILGANRLGIYTILVKPLGADSWASKIIPRRFLERYYLKKFKLL
ncbi:MAG: HAD hydrolase-like protein, partial [Candidatus Eremiobacteraeota bacterium]|nr:HAD hydrolase-like protein [Candidatus Eremiobacteraeota bacterium]